MPHNRYYLLCPSLSHSSSLRLCGKEAEHLIRVMRAKEGEEIEIVNGNRELARCVITKIEKIEACLEVLHIETAPPSPSFCLALALTKGDSLAWTIEKGVELGASSFLLFQGDLSEKKELSCQQQDRLRGIAISAMKQCGRLDLPEIVYKEKMGEIAWTEKSKDALIVVCDLVPYKPSALAPLLAARKEGKAIVAVIGPEKGFSSREKALFSSLTNTLIVSIHPHILRAETAPLAVLGIGAV